MLSRPPPTAMPQHGNMLYAHEAMRLVARSLETAVREPGNLAARGEVLLGSCYAASPSTIAALRSPTTSPMRWRVSRRPSWPATALGFEATLPGSSRPAPPIFTPLPARLASLPPLTCRFCQPADGHAGIARSLPRAFAAFSADDLAREMKAPENQPMRRSTIREVTDADIRPAGRRRDGPQQGSVTHDQAP